MQTCSKLWFSTVAVPRHVGDMPVVVHDRCLECRRGRRCDHAATSLVLANSGSAPDSVHRALFVDIPVPQQRQVLGLAAMAAMKGRWAWEAFTAALTPFFALLRLSRSAAGCGHTHLFPLTCV